MGAEIPLDPAGLGYAGWGVITGYTLEEARAVPVMPANDLFAYLDSVCAALAAELRSLPEGALHDPAPGLQEVRSLTRYQWVKSFLKCCIAHQGEIKAILSMHKRIAARAPEG